MISGGGCGLEDEELLGVLLEVQCGLEEGERRQSESMSIAKGLSSHASR